MDNKNTVTVKIYGQEYSISGDMPREYIIKLADYVDSKMQEVGACGNIPVSGVAVLTAVNMADDYFNLKKQAGDSEKYEMMWEDVKQSFARSREELEAVNAQAAELRRASIDKDKQLSELYGENSELKKNNEVLRCSYCFVPFLYSLFKYFVDKSVFHSFARGHEIVALGISCDFFDRLSGILGKDTVELFSCADDVIGNNLDFGGLTTCTAKRLVNHDFAVGKSNSLTLCA